MAQLLDVCGFLPNFLDKGTWRPTTPLQGMVLATLARSRGTYETIADLVESERSLQAAMLGRSLFEDMVVAHWLALHADNAEWLIKRFDDHAAAMRLHEVEMRNELGLSLDDDASDILDRAADLKQTYGRYAERNWWGQDEHGAKLTMPSLVARLAGSPRFHPRLRGEAPILEQYYALQHKAWTQALHHTAAGMTLRVPGGGEFPATIAIPAPALILAGNYWVFGQVIFVALELAAPVGANEYFEKLFLSGLAVFGEALGVPVPWAGRLAEWADEA